MSLGWQFKPDLALLRRHRFNYYEDIQWYFGSLFLFTVGYTQQIRPYYNYNPKWKAYCVYELSNPMLVFICVIKKSVLSPALSFSLSQLKFCIVVTKKEGVDHSLKFSLHNTIIFFTSAFLSLQTAQLGRASAS